MAHLPDKVVKVLEGGHMLWVGTATATGYPNITIKGSGAVVRYASASISAYLFSKKTRANLEQNPFVAIGIHDTDSHIAVQVKGRATLSDTGALLRKGRGGPQSQGAWASEAEIRRGGRRGVRLGHDSRAKCWRAACLAGSRRICGLISCPLAGAGNGWLSIPARSDIMRTIRVFAFPAMRHRLRERRCDLTIFVCPVT